jgi:hypothetical protein
VAARRGLEEVFHYFISEEEQARAREESPRTPIPETETGRAARWAVPADPARPLECALATELAAALGRAGTPTRIVAPFAPPPLLPRAREVEWHALAGENACDPAALRAALPADGCALLLIPPPLLAGWLSALEPADLTGVLLPVEASPRGPARALGALRALASAPRAWRLGLVAIDAPGDAEADDLLARIEGAARRQLGLRVVRLGDVRRDSASYRSLLLGVSVFDVDPDSALARGIESLGDRLRSARDEPAA